MIVIVLLINGEDANYQQGMRSLAPIIISITYYGCGLLSFYRYHDLAIYTVRSRSLFIGI